MLDYNKTSYKVKIEYPSQMDFVSYFVYKQGKVIVSDINTEDFRQCAAGFTGYGALPAGRYQTEMEKLGYVIEKIFNKKEYTASKEVYRAEQEKQEKQWKKDLLAEYGIDFENDSIGKLIFSKAWEDGHSDGYYSVDQHIEDLIDFIDDIMNAKKGSRYYQGC